MKRRPKPVVIWVAFDKRTGDVDDWATSKADLQNFYKHADSYVKYVPVGPDNVLRTPVRKKQTGR